MRKLSLSLLVWLVILTIVTAGRTAGEPQTVPVGTTRQLQNGIYLGVGLWAVPSVALQGKVATDCATSGTMFQCIQDQNAVALEAQSRGLALMNDVFANYANINQSLTNQNLWFQSVINGQLQQ